MNRRNTHRNNKTNAETRLRERNQIIFLFIVGLFSGLLLWKIVITPFTIDLSVMITFLLALFSIGISLFFYMKVNTIVNELKELFRKGQPINADVNRPSENDAEVLQKLDKSITQEAASNDELDPTLQLEFEERTLKLKEEERQELLERLLQRAGLDENEKKVYISQLEKVDNDLFNIRSNLNHLRRKINQSFSEMFILEKTKVIREIIEKLGPEFVRQEIFNEINDRFKMMKAELPKASLDLLDEHAYIDREGNLTRKGYREFIKVAKKMS